MRKCDLKELAEHEYHQTEAGPIPVLPVKVFREEIGKVLKIYALVDTGFSEGLIVSHTFGDYIKKRVKAPDEEATLFAEGGFGIPCEVYRLNVSISDRWFKVKAYLPKIADLGNILGRRLLGKINLCFRPEKLVVAG